MFTEALPVIACIGILFVDKNQWAIDSHKHMDGYQNNDAEWRNQPKRKINCTISFIYIIGTCELTYSDRNQIKVAWGLVWGQIYRGDAKKMRKLLRGLDVLYLIVVIVSQVCTYFKMYQIVYFKYTFLYVIYISIKMLKKILNCYLISNQ